MTTVAWDGAYLAADCQMSSGNEKSRVSKIVKLENGVVLAGAGPRPHVLELVELFKDGKLKSHWPEFQKDSKDSAILLVIEPRRVYYYSTGAVGQPIEVLEKRTAIGSGFAYAMGAMAYGATAMRAVEIAAKFDPGTGLGVDFTRAVVRRKRA